MKEKILTFSVLAVNLVYIAWRICFTLPVNGSKLALFFGMGLLIAELLGLFELLVYLYGRLHSKAPELPAVDKNEFPEIDVFIATYNEPKELLRKTIIGCKNMKYPDEKLVHIFLCDDGDRKEIKCLAEELGIHYLNRVDNKGAKAGNLNNAMKYSESPLIATFDADMIPMENFLMKTVPYFLDKDKKVGFIQTPQSFYNPDLFQTNLYSEDRIPNEQDYFYRNVQITKNHTNTVIYGGSNTLISRKALEEVGGFYEKSITEDFATGILIQKKGYQCYATNKPLASGLAPNDFKSLIKQRERWARGCIQTIKKLPIFFAKDFSFMQKVSYASAIVYWYAPVKRFFYIFSPIAFTVFGIQVIQASFHEVLLFFAPTYLITMFSINHLSGRIRNARWTNIYEIITFPSLIHSVLLETIGVSQKKFSVTNKNAQVDRDHKYHREKAIPFYFLSALSIIGIFNIIIYMPRYTTLNFLVLLFWLTINLLYLVMALFFISEKQKQNTTICYKEEIQFYLTDREENYIGITSEISDRFITFKIRRNMELEMGKELIAFFQVSDRSSPYFCELKVRVEKAKLLDSQCEYKCSILENSTSAQDLWSGFLHNRIPTMPQTIHHSKHIFEDLKINILARRS